MAPAAVDHQRCGRSEPLPLRSDVPRPPLGIFAPARRRQQFGSHLVRRSSAGHALLSQPAQLRSKDLHHPVAQLPRSLPKVGPPSFFLFILLVSLVGCRCHHQTSSKLGRAVSGDVIFFNILSASAACLMKGDGREKEKKCDTIPEELSAGGFSTTLPPSAVLPSRTL